MYIPDLNQKGINSASLKTRRALVTSAEQGLRNEHAFNNANVSHYSFKDDHSTLVR